MRSPRPARSSARFAVCSHALRVYLEHVTQEDPERKARLMKGLDGFLERDRDQGLFDLPTRV